MIPSFLSDFRHKSTHLDITQYFGATNPCGGAQIAGIVLGKQCNLLGEIVGEIVWQKVVPTSKKTILERDYRFFASLLSDMDLGNVDTREA